MSSLNIFILSILLLVVWYFLVRPLSYWKRRGVKQSESCWWFFGDVWRNFRSIKGKNSSNDFIEWMYQSAKNGRYFGIYEFNKPVLVVVDPELIKAITVKDFDSFSDHAFFAVDPEHDPLWGKNLLVIKGQEWKEMRSILSPSFTSSKMKMMFQLISENTNNFVEFFSQSNGNIIELEMKDAFSRFANDVIASTAFGLQVDSLKNTDNDFYRAGKLITDPTAFMDMAKFLVMSISPLLSKVLDLKMFPKEATTYFGEIIHEAIKYRSEKDLKRPDMLHLLLEARANQKQNGSKRVLSDDDILAQALIFFFAGFDTVSTALSFGSYELALNKPIQDRLREEIQINHTKHQKLSYDVLQAMPFMDMVVTEILRKWPPFVSTDRLVTKPYTIQPISEDERAVELFPGQAILIPIYGIQHDPKYFPEPEKFNPERWSDSNKGNVNPYTYLSFGIGPRLCIGNRLALMEIKALLFSILLNYEIVPTEKTLRTIRIESFPGSYQVEGGFWLGLKRIGEINKL